MGNMNYLADSSVLITLVICSTFLIFILLMYYPLIKWMQYKKTQETNLQKLREEDKSIALFNDICELVNKYIDLDIDIQRDIIKTKLGCKTKSEEKAKPEEKTKPEDKAIPEDKTAVEVWIKGEDKTYLENYNKEFLSGRLNNLIDVLHKLGYDSQKNDTSA